MVRGGGGMDPFFYFLCRWWKAAGNHTEARILEGDFLTQGRRGAKQDLCSFQQKKKDQPRKITGGKHPPPPPFFSFLSIFVSLSQTRS